MCSEWQVIQEKYNEKSRQAMEPVYTLGNGYIGCRGFFEEEIEGIKSLGGIYMAGVVGKADYKPWSGDGRELANTPNFFQVSICIDGEQVTVKEEVRNFLLKLDMKKGILTRSYEWESSIGNKVKIEFERFVSLDNIHLAGQRITIKTLDGAPEIELKVMINPNITNLNEISCEPFPVQPGRKHWQVIHQDDEIVQVLTEEPREIFISEGQRVVINKEKTTVAYKRQHFKEGFQVFKFQGAVGQDFELEKLISVHTSLEDKKNTLVSVREDLLKVDNYNEIKRKHIKKWCEKWEYCDIIIEGNEEDQRALRFNIFQLIQACPEHDSKYSIGARGLTGEMYEGCIFWDTEIFMLPFFTFTNPEASRKLLEFRYHTLPEARLHAKNNWFKGAMYPWQASEKGVEQTPHGVGAYYAIHIVSDIAYAILEYWYMTQDYNFMIESGIEILVETARFWESRVHKNKDTNEYSILAVRGPNEYDVIVNNNVYTNMMAQQNLILVNDMIELMKSKDLKQWYKLSDKLKFQDEEQDRWKDIVKNIRICYNKALDLYEEDDMYLNRVPLDMSKAKPTQKRIIDSTMSYESLMLYQVTKQADVLLLMKNLPWRFTREQVLKAWNYYVPRTCNDSSLSYSIHSVMASKLGFKEKAYEYFDISANLDMRNVQLNTVSGLHFANFGGTWQAVVFGFAGVSINKDALIVEPSLPTEWKSMFFSIWYRGNLLGIKITGNTIKVEVKVYNGNKIKLLLDNTEYIIDYKGEHEIKY